MPKLRRYRVHGAVHGSKYLGVYVAFSKKQAIEKASEERSGATVQLCHQCSSKVEDPSVEKIEAWEDKDADPDEEKPES